MLWIVVLAACSRTPEIEAVSPEEVSAGETLVIEGRHFGANTTARLVDPGSGEVPLRMETVGRERLEVTLPVRVREGSWTLVVEREGERATGADPVVVVPPLEEPACSDEYTANTELSLVRAEVVIDRYYRNGDKEQVQLSLEDIARVEFERAGEAEGACNAVYLRTTQGRRIVFHDDHEVDLRDRAYRIAQAMGKELEVVRPDGTAMSDDEAAE